MGSDNDDISRFTVSSVQSETFMYGMTFYILFAGFSLAFAQWTGHLEYCAMCVLSVGMAVLFDLVHAQQQHRAHDSRENYNSLNQQIKELKRQVIALELRDAKNN